MNWACFGCHELRSNGPIFFKCYTVCLVCLCLIYFGITNSGEFKVSNIFSVVEGEIFVDVIGNKYIGRFFIILMFGSLPFVVLLSVMKYANCSLIIGPLILIGTTPSCRGGILRVDLTVPIVAFCSQFLYMSKISLLFGCNNFFLCPMSMIAQIFFVC